MKKHVLKKIMAATVIASLLLTGCGAAAGEGSGEAVKETVEETTVSETEEPAQTKEETAEEAVVEDTSETEQGTQAAEVIDMTAEETKEEENNSTYTSELVPELDIKSMDLVDNEAMAFIRSMKLGWNLGNTLDAYNDGNLSDDLSTETYWGNPKTTKELIRGVHAAGFETIRIPISWHNHVDGNYNINVQWMARVKEIVDYACDEGMYVIINIHHDNHPEANGLYPDAARKDQSLKYVKTIWSQVAETFKDYDEHLVFEAMNEPRLVGHNNEWWIDNSNSDCKEAITIINELNQTFVDTVRATGGNNAQRYLMCPGYCASPDGVLNAGFQIPSDPADNRIILSVHAYTPYSFALEYPGTSEFDHRLMNSYQDIDAFMNKLYYKYIREGIPVLIGEFGARDKSGNLEDRVRYSTYYIARARSYGMTACWWDNGAFTGSGELFGLMNRDNGKVVYQDILAGLVRYCE